MRSGEEPMLELKSAESVQRNASKDDLASVPSRQSQQSFNFKAEKAVTVFEKYAERFLGWYPRRGELKGRGANYYEPALIEEVYGSLAVGVAYAVNSLADVDMIQQSFRTDLEIDFQFCITKDELAVFREYRDRGEFDMKEMFSDKRVKSKFAPLRVKNTTWESAESPRYSIHQILFAFNPRMAEWQWYVRMFCKMRLSCRADFELQEFPYTRQLLDVVLCNEGSPVERSFFVPYHSQMPEVERRIKVWGEHSEEPEELGEESPVAIRPNRLNASGCAGDSTWRVENHHLAIPDKSLLDKLPSGYQFAECIITVQVEHNNSFFWWNTVPMVAALPVFAGIAVLEPASEVANRSSIVFALLLTMSTYKLSITGWMPKKSYLTYLDKYILVGFLCILLIGLLVAISALVTFLFPQQDSDVVRAVIRAEQYIVLAIIALWVMLHLWLCLCRGRLYRPWDDLFKADTERRLHEEDLDSIQFKSVVGSSLWKH